MSLSGSVLSRTLNIPPERRRKENEEKRAKRGKDKNSSVYTIAKKEFMLPHRRNVHGTCELISPKRITSLNRADSCLVAIHFTFVRKGETLGYPHGLFHGLPLYRFNLLSCCVYFGYKLFRIFYLFKWFLGYKWIWDFVFRKGKFFFIMEEYKILG